MKKIIIAFIVLNILLVPNFVMAYNNDSFGKKIVQKGHYSNSLRSEIRQLSKTIDDNEIRINRKISDSKNAYNRAKANVARLLKKQDKLMQVEIDALIKAIDSLEAYKETLNSNNSNIDSEFKKLDNAKKRNDLVLQKRIMNKIIKLQNSRIAELNKSISCMNKIANM